MRREEKVFCKECGERIHLNKGIMSVVMSSREDPVEFKDGYMCFHCYKKLRKQ